MRKVDARAFLKKAVFVGKWQKMATCRSTRLDKLRHIYLPKALEMDVRWILPRPKQGIFYV